MPDKQIACPKCSCTATVETNGHLEFIRCQWCGWTQTSTIIPRSEVTLIDESPDFVTVQIHWSSQSDISKQVILARQLFEQLGSISLSKVLQQAKESETFSLGTFSMPIAIDMKERAKANGISVSFVKLEPSKKADCA